MRSSSESELPATASYIPGVVDNPRRALSERTHWGAGWNMLRIHGLARRTCSRLRSSTATEYCNGTCSLCYWMESGLFDGRGPLKACGTSFASDSPCGLSSQSNWCHEVDQTVHLLQGDSWSHTCVLTASLARGPLDALPCTASAGRIYVGISLLDAPIDAIASGVYLAGTCLWRVLAYKLRLRVSVIRYPDMTACTAI